MPALFEKSEKVTEVLNKYQKVGREQLIPILQEVQNEEGYLSKGAVVQIGRHLNLPTSKIYGVATFYNQFRFKPFGKYHIMICRGTACHVKGSQPVLEILEESLAIKAGDTTKDGVFSIEVVACIGACGLAPVVSVNGEFYGNVDQQKINKIIRRYRSEESV
ncbi:MAG: NADH-quinone oxidoreductase subunit NuoE [Bacteriovoracaceae bacterium]|nr:NADH-quinone oxidoreductase subunit NuoE [Bacteriovoracaceae bacterium]